MFGFRKSKKGKVDLSSITKQCKEYFEKEKDAGDEARVKSEQEEVFEKRTIRVDDYFIEAANLVVEMKTAWIGSLQKEFEIGVNRANRIIEELYEEGIVGKSIGERRPRNVLMTKEQLEEYLSNVEIIPYKNKESVICKKETFANEKIVDMYNKKYDYMTGEDFEVFVAQILRETGFYDIQLTKGSGDQGVDILAEKDNIKYAIQCKRYDKPVGNKAVQEVFSGKFYYHCHTAVVVTNNYFTQSAKDLAYENGVVLWDRNILEKYILLGSEVEIETKKIKENKVDDNEVQSSSNTIIEKCYYINDDYIQFSLQGGNYFEILGICRNKTRAANLYFSFYIKFREEYSFIFDFHIAIRYGDLLAIAENKNGEEIFFGQGETGEIEVGIPYWMEKAKDELLNRNEEEFIKMVEEANVYLDEFMEEAIKYIE